MKPNVLFKWLLPVFLFSCGNDAAEDEVEEFAYSERIDVKAYPDDESNTVSFLALTQKASIDWGDGSVDEIVPGGGMKEFVHVYRERNLHDIKIYTERLKSISFPAKGVFTELHFGDFRELEEIDCPNQQLTVLEIKNAESLALIDCRNNDLSASVLNVLFESLPENTKGYIYYMENAGAVTCDNSILYSKGWTDDRIIPSESLFDREERVVAVLNVTLRNVSDFVREYYLIESLYSNTVEYDNSLYRYKDVYEHRVTPSNNTINDLWINAYRTMRGCNSIIKGVMEQNKADYNDYLYTAIAARAYLYLVMTNCWGDIPFVNEKGYDNPDQMVFISRMPREQIYLLLLDELLVAESYLPEAETDERISFSKSFVRLLLSKIYALRHDYSKSFDCLMKIVDGGRHGLSGDYQDIYGNKNNAELITGQIYPYDYEDGRNQGLVDIIRKGTYMPLCRYAEVLLLASENSLRMNDSQKAAAFLNLLRGRNNRPVLERNIPADRITEIILEEYKLDLGKEGVYFEALKRFDEAEKRLNIAPYQRYLPIPQKEIDINPNITQNEGYPDRL
ncbi:MAG: RagB/SusD family nutrient uptake outer membrane protein [Tannerella sp.]|jgi:hypothetical protein|nr:RagB/SusD family nutrient uptake outer membrane protein [Tannerella sp.]